MWKLKIWKKQPVHTSFFPKNFNLSGLKQDFDKLYVDKLKSTGADLTKLINVINNEVAKKTVYDELDKKNQCHW